MKEEIIDIIRNHKKYSIHPEKTAEEILLLFDMKKLLDLSDDCIKEIAKEAIDKGTDFKNWAQDILEAHAKTIIADKQKSDGKK